MLWSTVSNDIIIRFCFVLKASIQYIHFFHLNNWLYELCSFLRGSHQPPWRGNHPESWRPPEGPAVLVHSSCVYNTQHSEYLQYTTNAKYSAFQLVFTRLYHAKLKAFAAFSLHTSSLLLPYVSLSATPRSSRATVMSSDSSGRDNMASSHPAHREGNPWEKNITQPSLRETDREHPDLLVFTWLRLEQRKIKLEKRQMNFYITAGCRIHVPCQLESAWIGHTCPHTHTIFHLNTSVLCEGGCESFEPSDQDNECLIRWQNNLCLCAFVPRCWAKMGPPLNTIHSSMLFDNLKK